MLEGTNGDKMSTSQGNVINIVDEPSDMFGKLMSMKDGLIIKYMRLCSDVEKEEVEEAEKFLENRENNPRDLKLKVAKSIVTIYHGEAAAAKAEINFITAFQKGGIPDDVQVIGIEDSNLELGNVLVENKIIKSKAEFKRLIETSSIKYLDQSKDNEEVVVKDFKINSVPGTYKVGKKIFVKLEQL